jgi:hypothetical protein
MKKYILILSLFCLSTLSFSSPVNHYIWDKPLWDDPFLTDFSITENSLPHRVDIAVTMDHSVNYTIKVTFIVYGNWVGLGWDYKEFNVYVSPYTTYKLTQFSISTYDDPWVDSYDILYMGPI